MVAGLLSGPWHSDETACQISVLCLGESSDERQFKGQLGLENGVACQRGQ